MNTDNPEILSNIDIDILTKRFIKDIDCFCVSKDRLKQMKPETGGYIINLQDSTEGFGTHWVSLYLNDICVYFDSFGMIYPIEVLEFCRRYKKQELIYNPTQIQHIKQECCGYYCIMFLHYMSGKNTVYYDKDFYLSNFIKKFDIMDFDKNDRIVKRYFKNLDKIKM